MHFRVTSGAGLRRKGGEIELKKLMLAAILAATMALSLASVASAGVIPPCC